jgi:Tol biopolymer transport system component
MRYRFKVQMLSVHKSVTFNVPNLQVLESIGLSYFVKKVVYIFILFVLAGFTSNAIPSYIDYAYEQDNNIFYHVINTDKIFKIENASNPSLAPDGSKLAYRKYLSSKPGCPSVIDIFYFRANTTHTLNTKTVCNHSPKWSPDGSQLAFVSIINNKFSISLFDSTKFIRAIYPSVNSDLADFNWLCDNISFSINDLDSIWQIDTSGSVKKSFDIKKITKGSWIETPTNLFFTENNNFIYFDAYNDTGTTRRFPGLPGAIYQYSFENDSLTRLTSNQFQSRGDFILCGQVIFVSAFTNSKKNGFSIFKIEKGQAKEIIKNASNITVSTKNSL